MPNGTYGGVRGRKTKVGGKLTTFAFLLLYYRPMADYSRPETASVPSVLTVPGVAS